MRTLRLLAILAVLAGLVLSGCATMSKPDIYQDLQNVPDFGDGVPRKIHAARTGNQEGEQLLIVSFWQKKQKDDEFKLEFVKDAHGQGLTFKTMDVFAAFVNGALGQYLRRPNITRFSIANESQGGSAYSSSWADAFLSNWNSNSNWN